MKYVCVSAEVFILGLVIFWFLEDSNMIASTYLHRQSTHRHTNIFTNPANHLSMLTDVQMQSIYRGRRRSDIEVWFISFQKFL